MTALFTSATGPAAQAPKTRRMSLIGRLSIWQERRALARLDAARLHDLGLSRREADAEAGRPFWDAPDTWRR